MTITLSALATVGGVSAAVLAVVGVLKALTGLTGRATQLVAIVLGMVFMAVGNHLFPSQVADIAILLANGALAGAAAVGLHQIGPGLKADTI